MERVNKMLDEDIKNFQILTKPGKNESGKNLENITFEARSTRTPFQSRFQQIEVFVAQQQALGKTTAAEIYNAYKAFDPAGELCLISGPRHVQYILDRQRRLKQVRETSNNVDARLSRPYQKRPKEIQVDVAEQQNCGKPAEIYKFIMANAPAAELLSINRPRNRRQQQLVLDRQRRLEQSRGQGSKCGTSPFTTLVNFTLLGNKSEMVSYADDSTTFLK
jgi:hypothetical protein